MKFKPQITDIILIVSLVALCFGVFKISNLENENRVMQEKIKVFAFTNADEVIAAQILQHI